MNELAFLGVVVVAASCLLVASLPQDAPAARVPCLDPMQERPYDTAEREKLRLAAGRGNRWAVRLVCM